MSLRESSSSSLKTSALRLALALSLLSIGSRPVNRPLDASVLKKGHTILVPVERLGIAPDGKRKDRKILMEVLNTKPRSSPDEDVIVLYSSETRSVEITRTRLQGNIYAPEDVSNARAGVFQATPDIRDVDPAVLSQSFWESKDKNIVKLLEALKSDGVSDVPAYWKQLKRGLLNHAAMMAGLANGRKIFFLGRDGAWQFFANQALEHSDRSRLIFVSRDIKSWSTRSPLNTEALKKYLASEGLRDSALVFDTGFNGSIVNYLKELLPETDLTGLLHVANWRSRYSPSRPFLAAFDSEAAVEDRKRLCSRHHDIVSTQARLPSFWKPFTHLEMDESSELLPVAQRRAFDPDGGVIDEKLALLFLRDLKWELSQGPSRKRYLELKGIWSELNELQIRNSVVELTKRIGSLKSSQDVDLRAIGYQFEELSLHELSAVVVPLDHDAFGLDGVRNRAPGLGHGDVAEG